MLTLTLAIPMVISCTLHYTAIYYINLRIADKIEEHFVKRRPFMSSNAIRAPTFWKTAIVRRNYKYFEWKNKTVMRKVKVLFNLVRMYEWTLAIQGHC